METAAGAVLLLLLLICCCRNFVLSTWHLLECLCCCCCCCSSRTQDEPYATLEEEAPAATDGQGSVQTFKPKSRPPQPAVAARAPGIPMATPVSPVVPMARPAYGFTQPAFAPQHPPFTRYYEDPHARRRSDANVCGCLGCLLVIAILVVAWSFECEWHESCHLPGLPTPDGGQLQRLSSGGQAGYLHEPRSAYMQHLLDQIDDELRTPYW